MVNSHGEESHQAKSGVKAVATAVGRSLAQGCGKERRGSNRVRIDAYLRMLISPQMVVSLEISPISMKYLHNWICTTAAKYQQI